MQPVKYSLWVKFSVIRIADVEDIFPRDQNILEDSQVVQFIAERRQRMLDTCLIAFDGAPTTNDGHAFGIYRHRGEDDLICRNARPEKHADMDPVAEGGTSTDC